MARLPSTITLDEEMQVFYAALGKSITQWQDVESILATIFAAVVSGDVHRRSVGNAAFHAVVSFKPKLDMIDSAMVAAAYMSPLERGPFADKSMFSEWNSLHNRIGKRADRRNEIAHFAMHIDTTKASGRRCFLAPNIINMNALIKHAGEPPIRTICILVAQGNSFEKLANDLQAFYSKWVALKAWPFAASL